MRRSTHRDREKTDRDVARDELQESGVQQIVVSARVNANDEHSLRNLLPRFRKDGDNDRMARSLLPSSLLKLRRQVPEVFDKDGFATHARFLEGPAPAVRTRLGFGEGRGGMGGRRVAGKNGGEVDLYVGGGEGVVIGDADGSLRKLSGRVRWERRKGTNLSGQLDIQLIWLLLPGKPDLARTERLVGRDF